MGVTPHGRTERLDLADPTVREWSCPVLSVDPEQGTVLDRSAFHPGGGGQPPDHGVLLWQGVQTRTVGTRKGDDLYLPLVTGGNMRPGEVRRDGLDVRADGGTHVGSTGQIGEVRVVKVESKGRANRRVRPRLV